MDFERVTTWRGVARAFDAALQDLRYALTRCRRSPGFPIVAILSIALGSGANTAVFQLLDAVRLRTVPVRDAEQLVQLRVDDMTHARGTWLRDSALTNPLWEEIRKEQRTFSDVFAWADERLDLSSHGEIRNAAALWVSGEFFPALGVRPVLGRVFGGDDDRRGCGRGVGVVLSYSFWQREFGGDPNIVGRTIALGRERTEVIGVTPREFFGLQVGRNFDVAIPICAEPAWHGRDDRLDSGTVWWLTVMGRLKRGISVRQAGVELQAASATIFQATLPTNDPQASVRPYLDMRLVPVPAARGLSRLREQYSTPLVVLLVTTGLVLAIACINLAHLMLARTAARQREIAVRVAIGASRPRIAGQLLVEGLLLAMAGVTAGLLISRWLTQVVIAFLASGDSTTFLDVSLDWATFAFTGAVCIVTTAIFAAAPALRVVRAQPAVVLAWNARHATASGSATVRRLLLALQIPLSLALLMGTLLFTGTLRSLRTVDPGFQARGVVVASISFAGAGVSPGRAAAFRREILDRVRSSPDVEAAAEVAIVPLSENWNNRVWMDGSDPAQARVSFRNMISPDYFRTMGMRLLAGRDFSDVDLQPGAERVVIVNEEPNAAYLDLHDPPQPEMFVPTSQTAAQAMGDQLVIRSRRPGSIVIPSIRGTLDRISPPVRYSLRPFDAAVEASLAPERLMALVSEPFAVLAVVLTAVGLYGVTSYVVARRGNEIGIRMALGADARGVIALILGETAAVVVGGLIGGIALTLVGGRTASALLYRMPWYDPGSLGVACGVIVIVALTAAYLPARRAGTLDVVAALRHQ